MGKNIIQKVAAAIAAGITEFNGNTEIRDKKLKAQLKKEFGIQDELIDKVLSKFDNTQKDQQKIVDMLMKDQTFVKVSLQGQSEKIDQQDEKISQQDEKISQQDEKITQQDGKICQLEDKNNCIALELSEFKSIVKDLISSVSALQIQVTQQAQLRLQDREYVDALKDLMVQSQDQMKQNTQTVGQLAKFMLEKEN